MRTALTAALCVTLLAGACGGRTDTGPAPADEARTTQPAVRQAAVRPASGVVAPMTFGVKECDDYLARYTECIGAKVPSEVRAAMMAALDRSRSQWLAAAATPEGRAGLAESCTRARDAARASMQAYGCRW